MHLFSSAGLYLMAALIAQAISALHLPLSSNPLPRLYQRETAVHLRAVDPRQPYPDRLPLLADCQMLLANVTGTPGYYNISHWPGDSVLSPFMTNNTCQLVVAKMGSDLSQNATIGNGDVEKFISMMLNQQNGTCSQTGRPLEQPVPPALLDARGPQRETLRLPLQVLVLLVPVRPRVRVAAARAAASAGPFLLLLVLHLPGPHRVDGLGQGGGGVPDGAAVALGGGLGGGGGLAVRGGL
ncbi:hypothetical protein PG985_010296 [Apiospora marii]|uniref:Ecp2 effector protein-like domain-containing protein n=1 Tax=Apiospora marii TaxID=335849 RepID=A0ABR1RLH2_9PEZI